MQQPIGLLSDNMNWIQPLVRAMDAAGLPSRLIPLTHPPFTGFDREACPDVIFNRVAIRTAMGSPGLVTLVRDLLSALQLQGKHIINNSHCHHVGASKALQALVFERAGVMSPRTLVLHDKAMLAAARKVMPDGMLKSNVGGFGAGIWVPVSPDQEVPPSILDAAFAADGMAVWQQRYVPRDDVIYRVELLGGEVLYRARVPVKPDSFDNCLGNAGSFAGPGSQGDPITLDQARTPCCGPPCPASANLPTWRWAAWSISSPPENRQPAFSTSTRFPPIIPMPPPFWVSIPIQNWPHGLKKRSSLDPSFFVFEVGEGVVHVGQVDGLHELPLKVFFQGQFHVRHVAGNPIRFNPLVPVQQGNPAPVPGGVAHGNDLVQGAIRKHADHQRQPAVDVGSECTGNLYAVDPVHPHFFSS